MKGYKATYNMKCLTLTYEVGKTYEIDNMKMCFYGFHFCEKMEDVLVYYAYKSDFVLLEVEALGDVERVGNKSLTNKLKVLRIVPKEEYTFDLPIEEYDSNGNLIHYKDSNGYEEWKEYDSQNKLIHYKDSNGYEYWKEYDSQNNLIHYKDYNGYEEWKEYDSQNNLIHYKNSNGYEDWKEYDSQNNLIHYKDCNRFEYWKEYDSQNNLIYFKDSTGLEWNITIK